MKHPIGVGLDKHYELKLLHKVFDVIECFTLDEPEYSLAELQKKLNLHKATLYRIVLNLEEREYLQKSRISGKYRIGAKFARVANAWLAGLDLSAIAQPFARTLAQKTGETVIINMIEGYRGICIMRINSTQPVKITAEIGRSVPLLRGASGKILAAYCDEQYIVALYDKENENLTATLQQIYQQMLEIREKGYAVSFEELDRDTAGVSFPIRDAAGKVIAGLSVIGPLFRLTAEHIPGLVDLTGKCAAQISQELGYRPMLV